MSVGEWKRFKKSVELSTIHLTDEEILYKQISVCRMAKKIAQTELDQYDASKDKPKTSAFSYLNQIIINYKKSMLEKTISQNQLMIENGEMQIQKIEKAENEWEKEMLDFVEVQRKMGITCPLHHTKHLSSEFVTENKIAIQEYVKALKLKEEKIRITAERTKQMIRQFKDDKIIAHEIVKIATSILSNIQHTEGVILMRRDFPHIQSARLQIFSTLINRFKKVYSAISYITTYLYGNAKFVDITKQNRQIKMLEKIELVDELGIIVDAITQQDKFFNPEKYDS